VRLVCDHDDEALALLASHDSDAVNRWDAAQRSYVNAILRLAHAQRNGNALSLPPLLTQVVRRLLDDDASDPSKSLAAWLQPREGKDTQGLPGEINKLLKTVAADKRTPAQQKIDSQLLYALKMERAEPVASGVNSLQVEVGLVEGCL